VSIISAHVHQVSHFCNIKCNILCSAPISITGFPDSFPKQNRFLYIRRVSFVLECTCSVLVLNMTDDRWLQVQRVFTAVACEVSTRFSQLLEIAHCLASSYEIHIAGLRMGWKCVRRYAWTTGIILVLQLSRFYALKRNRLFAVWVFWLPGPRCWTKTAVSQSVSQSVSLRGCPIKPKVAGLVIKSVTNFHVCKT
jgi:hypothetical protein